MASKAMFFLVVSILAAFFSWQAEPSKAASASNKLNVKLVISDYVSLGPAKILPALTGIASASLGPAVWLAATNNTAGYSLQVSAGTPQMMCGGQQSAPLNEILPHNYLTHLHLPAFDGASASESEAMVKDKQFDGQASALPLSAAADAHQSRWNTLCMSTIVATAVSF